jgi:hypothetical protein
VNGCALRATAFDMEECMGANEMSAFKPIDRPQLIIKAPNTSSEFLRDIQLAIKNLFQLVFLNISVRFWEIQINFSFHQYNASG